MDPNASNVLMYHDMPTEGNPISDDACVCYMRVRQRKREYQSRGQLLGCENGVACRRPVGANGVGGIGEQFSVALVGWELDGGHKR